MVTKPLHLEFSESDMPLERNDTSEQPSTKDNSSTPPPSNDQHGTNDVIVCTEGIRKYGVDYSTCFEENQLDLVLSQSPVGTSSANDGGDRPCEGTGESSACSDLELKLSGSDTQEEEAER